MEINEQTKTALLNKIRRGEKKNNTIIKQIPHYTNIKRFSSILSSKSSLADIKFKNRVLKKVIKSNTLIFSPIVFLNTSTKNPMTKAKIKSSVTVVSSFLLKITYEKIRGVK